MKATGCVANNLTCTSNNVVIRARSLK